MRRIWGTLSFVLAAACGSSGSAPPAPAEEGTPPPAERPRDAGVWPDTPIAPDASSDEPPCERSPCPLRPVVFVHGFQGSNDDFLPLLSALVAQDARYDSFRLAGAGDFTTWPARSVARRSWLFSFDYYVAAKEDARGSYTAGPGRIGSDRSFACAAPAGAGHVLASSTDYDADVTHEYAADLAAFVDRVLLATGATEIDLVAHSMGGLVARSFLTFHGGAQKTKTALLLASPWDGVGAAALGELVGLGGPGWMKKHEIAELDSGGLFSQVRFRSCGSTGDASQSWPDLLREAEIRVAPYPAIHVMSAQLDALVSYDAAHHPDALSHEVVPGATHGGMLSKPETLARVRALTGGTFSR